MIKALIFDWGGVLVRRPTPKIIAQTAAYFNVSEAAITQQFILHKSKFQTGALSEHQFWEHLCQGIRCPPPQQPLWKQFLRQAYQENQELFSCIQEWKTQDYKIGFLSNTEPPSVELFYEQSYTVFDAIMFSCEQGLRKPHPELYQRILKKLSVQPQQAVFVDDLRENIKGAQKVGMKAVPFTTNENLKRKLQQIL